MGPCGRRLSRTREGISEKMTRHRVRNVIDVPLFYDGSARSLSLAYGCSALEDGTRPALVVLVGGPGLAAIKPYRTFQRKAWQAGFRVIMPEHRGIGYSRKTTTGQDMPLEAARMVYAAQDVVAILDYHNIDKAWILGSSYGSYLAQNIGAIAPSRVAGMFLDSGLPAARYEHYIRRRNRRLLWRGVNTTRNIAALVRNLYAAGEMSDDNSEALFAIYEWLGPKVLLALLEALKSGATWEYRLVHRILGARFRKSVEASLIEKWPTAITSDNPFSDVERAVTG